MALSDKTIQELDRRIDALEDQSRNCLCPDERCHLCFDRSEKVARLNEILGLDASNKYYALVKDVYEAPGDHMTVSQLIEQLQKLPANSIIHLREEFVRTITAIKMYPGQAVVLTNKRLKQR